jgi:rod shape determining protein RodA
VGKAEIATDVLHNVGNALNSVNVGVNLGLVPLTGLTLPLFSTGGSSMLTTFAALGLALGLCAHREPVLDADSFKAY